jgi:hypothetical protein
MDAVSPFDLDSTDGRAQARDLRWWQEQVRVWHPLSEP